jgi:hypothetical protein
MISVALAVVWFLVGFSAGFVLLLFKRSQFSLKCDNLRARLNEMSIVNVRAVDKLAKTRRDIEALSSTLIGMQKELRKLAVVTSEHQTRQVVKRCADKLETICKTKCAPCDMEHVHVGPISVQGDDRPAVVI